MCVEFLLNGHLLEEKKISIRSSSLVISLWIHFWPFDLIESIEQYVGSYTHSEM